ncbi:hypothetical protein CCX46_09570 [Pseudomonas sp. RU47]|nr:hypothetical protein CCX46_09570 [Pseudomonas sp. RU47]
MSASPVNGEFSGYREQTVEAMGRSMFIQVSGLIVPMLRVGMPHRTLRVRLCTWDAERPGLHSHAERGNDQSETKMPGARPGILCSSSAADWRIRMAVSYRLAGSCRRSCCPFCPGCFFRSCAQRR